jgi:hypothetical protein
METPQWRLGAGGVILCNKVRTSTIFNTYVLVRIKTTENRQTNKQKKEAPESQAFYSILVKLNHSEM